MLAQVVAAGKGPLTIGDSAHVEFLQPDAVHASDVAAQMLGAPEALAARRVLWADEVLTFEFARLRARRSIACGAGPALDLEEVLGSSAVRGRVGPVVAWGAVVRVRVVRVPVCLSLAIVFVADRGAHLDVCRVYGVNYGVLL